MKRGEAKALTTWMANREAAEQPSVEALDMAQKLIERDKETPPERRRIEVGRGGLMLLANEIVSLTAALERAERLGEGYYVDAQQARARAQKAEAALRGIANATPDPDPLIAVESFAIAQRVARAALVDEPPTEQIPGAGQTGC
jgi:hypothetical protein